MLNRQEQAITGMYQSTFIAPFMGEAGFIPTAIILDYCQRRYIYRLLTLVDEHPTKDILPIFLKIGDEKAQLEKLSENDKI